MTYNFDPDRWYENELAVLRASLRAGKISLSEFEAAETMLDKRLEEMWRRIDGTYQIPNQGPQPEKGSD